MSRARGEIDTLNVFPVADSDTGTNLHLTMEAVAEAAETQQGPPAKDDLARTLRAVTRGALIGARGNSGVLISQVWRGLAEVLPRTVPCRGLVLGEGLRHAASLAYAAVARPVEGTLLTVIRAAGDAAGHSTDDLGAVARAASDGARDALGRTTGQLDALARAGVVDAGGAGVCILLDALVAVVSERRSDPMLATPLRTPAARTGPTQAQETMRAGQPEHGASGESDEHEETGQTGPGYEVMYLLDAGDSAIPALRARLSELGDSLLIVGGEPLFNVHVHVDDAGAAIEAGLVAGRPHRIQVSYLRPEAPHRMTYGRGVVVLAAGEGAAALFGEAGGTVLRRTPERPPSADEMLQAIRSAGDEVILLPNDRDTCSLAEDAAERAREDRRHVSVVPTKATVQGLAALAVHDPQRRFEDDVIAMTAAAGGTRFGGLTVATGPAVTSAGICQAGDVLGLIDDDVALIGADAMEAAVDIVDRMLAGGGELVTLVTGEGSPAGLADSVVAHLRRVRPDVDSATHAGGQPGYPLLVGVE